MKKYCLVIYIFAICACQIIASTQPYFIIKNSQGIDLTYRLCTDSTVTLTGSGDTIMSVSEYDATLDPLNYSFINLDTVVVPEYIVVDEKEYKVSRLAPFGTFCNNTKITTVLLPKTIELIGDTIKYNETDPLYDPDWDYNYAFVNMPSLKTISIDSTNQYYTSENGILYDKNKKTLINYPQGRTDTAIVIRDGIEKIGRCAFMYSTLKYIEFPLSLKSIGNQAFWGGIKNVSTLIIKDSVEFLGDFSFKTLHRDSVLLDKVIIGTGIKFIQLLGLPKTKALYVYATNPPNFIYANYYDTTYLFVPRQSIGAYAAADGWKEFKHIYPIEPPVVAGVNEATVYWANNFSATGYEWILYTDEAHTQMYITLKFDADGHLSGIVLPQKSGVRSAEDDGKLWSEYYSFTIENLSPNITYYYVHQALKDDEVISEESGSFTTGGTSTALPDRIQTDTPQVRKVMENGVIYIVHPNGEKYTLTGQRAE